MIVKEIEGKKGKMHQCLRVKTVRGKEMLIVRGQNSRNVSTEIYSGLNIVELSEIETSHAEFIMKAAVSAKTVKYNTSYLGREWARVDERDKRLSEKAVIQLMEDELKQYGYEISYHNSFGKRIGISDVRLQKTVEPNEELKGMVLKAGVIGSAAFDAIPKQLLVDQLNRGGIFKDTEITTNHTVDLDSEGRVTHYCDMKWPILGTVQGVRNVIEDLGKIFCREEDVK